MRSRVLVLTGAALIVAAVAIAQDKPATPPAAAPAKPAVEAAKPAAAPAVDAAVKSIDAQIAALKIDKKNAAWRTSLKMPTKATFDPAKAYYMRMVTNKGEMLIKFKPDVAPIHVTNFIYLSRMGYFDGLKFHRVITRFMAQGGDPLGNGMGGPGYGFGGEFSPNVKHNVPGLLSMANAGPGTDGSQFFLTFVPTPWLDGKHTIFGQVEEGLDVLKKLEAAGSQSGATSELLKIEKTTIEVR